MDPNFCPQCRAELSPGAIYCSRCGAVIRPATVPHAAAPKTRFPTAAIVTVSLIGIVVVTWLLLSGLPFGDEKPRRDELPRYETVSERESTTTLAEPPPAADTIEPAPAAEEAPRVIEKTRPESRKKPDVAPASAGEIGESDATSVVTSYIRGRDYYRTPSSCLSIRNTGYSNRGYTIEVASRCEDAGGAPRFLGRWRVDAVTREVFRQRDDGRYLKP